MADSRIDDAFAVSEMGAQFFRRLGIHSRVRRAPDQQRRHIGDLWEDGFQLLQAVGPVTDNAECVLEAAGDRDRSYIAFERSGRDPLGIAEQSCQPVREGPMHVVYATQEERGAQCGAQKGSETASVW